MIFRTPRKPEKGPKSDITFQTCRQVYSLNKEWPWTYEKIFQKHGSFTVLVLVVSTIKLAEVGAYNASSFYFGPIWHSVITTSALSTTQVAWAEVNIAQNTVKS